MNTKHAIRITAIVVLVSVLTLLVASVAYAEDNRFTRLGQSLTQVNFEERYDQNPKFWDFFLFSSLFGLIVWIGVGNVFKDNVYAVYGLSLVVGVLFGLGAVKGGLSAEALVPFVENAFFFIIVGIIIFVLHKLGVNIFLSIIIGLVLTFILFNVAGFFGEGDASDIGDISDVADSIGLGFDFGGESYDTLDSIYDRLDSLRSDVARITKKRIDRFKNEELNADGSVKDKGDDVETRAKALTEPLEKEIAKLEKAFDGVVIGSTQVANLRNYIFGGSWPPKDVVTIKEMEKLIDNLEAEFTDKAVVKRIRSLADGLKGTNADPTSKGSIQAELTKLKGTSTGQRMKTFIEREMAKWSGPGTVDYPAIKSAIQGFSASMEWFEADDNTLDELNRLVSSLTGGDAADKKNAKDMKKYIVEVKGKPGDKSTLTQIENIEKLLSHIGKLRNDGVLLEKERDEKRAEELAAAGSSGSGGSGSGFGGIFSGLGSGDPDEEVVIPEEVAIRREVERIAREKLTTAQKEGQGGLYTAMIGKVNKLIVERKKMYYDPDIDPIDRPSILLSLFELVDIRIKYEEFRVMASRIKSEQIITRSINRQNARFNVDLSRFKGVEEKITNLVAVLKDVEKKSTDAREKRFILSTIDTLENILLKQWKDVEKSEKDRLSLIEGLRKAVTDHQLIIYGGDIYELHESARTARKEALFHALGERVQRDMKKFNADGGYGIDLESVDDIFERMNLFVTQLTAIQAKETNGVKVNNMGIQIRKIENDKKKLEAIKI